MTHGMAVYSVNEYELCDQYYLFKRFVMKILHTILTEAPAREIARNVRVVMATMFVLSILAAGMFSVFEPALSEAIDDTHLVQQSVTAEIIFDTTASDVVLAPAIPGLSGGTASGQTDVRVVTNNPNGYSMAIAFEDDVAMQGDLNGGQILNYTQDISDTPDFTFAVAANTGEFGYTVEAESAPDLAPAFLDDGGTCGVGTLDSVDSCWAAPSSTAQTVVNRTSVTDTDGASTTIKYRVQITPNADPLIPADTYTATTTLTALMN